MCDIEPILEAPEIADPEPAKPGRNPEVCQKACVVASIAAAISLGVALAVLSANKQHAQSDANDVAADLQTIILNPDRMYAAFGFVSAPLLFTSLKGIFTFGVQQLLFFGRAAFGGKEAMVEKNTAPLRFSKVSVAFQILGLTTTSYSFTSLAMIVQPWAGWAEWKLYSHLTSQHAGAVTVIVGLFNNAAVASFVTVDAANPAPYDEAFVARALAVAGALVGMPLWTGFLSTSGWQLLFVVLAAFLAFCLLQFSGTAPMISALRYGDCFSSDAVVGLKFAYCFRAVFAWWWIFMLALIWLLAGIWQGHAWLLAGATLLELFLPLAAVIVGAVVYLSPRGNPPLMPLTFVFAMTAVYILTVVTPAGLLMQEGSANFYDAAPSAFMAKRIGPFVNYTFAVPAKRGAQAAGAALTSSSQMQLWVAQLLSWFT